MRFVYRSSSIVSVLWASFALSACGSGSSALTPAPAPRATSTTTATPTMMPSAASSSATGTAQVTISFSTNTTSAHRRSDSYLSPKTASIELAVTSVNGTVPANPIYSVIDVSGSGSPCTVNAGTVACTIAVAAPVGNDVFSARTYAQADGAGQPLSIGTASAVVSAGAAVVVPMTFLPVVSYVVATITPGQSFAIGSPATFTLQLTAEDVTLTPIGGTDPYYSPIVVSSTDTGGHVTATPALPATLTAPGQTVSFTYDGKGVAASYLFSYAVKGDAVSGGVLPTTGAISFTSATQHLYVSTDGAVNVYGIAQDGTLSGLVRSISGTATGFTRPGRIFVDSLGALYVVNSGHSIEVFPAGANGNVAPMETIAQGEAPTFVGKNGDTGVAVVGSNQYGLSQVSFGSIYPSAVPHGAMLSTGSSFLSPYTLDSFAIAPSASIACGGSVPQAEENASYVVCFPGNPIAIDANGVPLLYYRDFQGEPATVAFRSDGKLAVVQVGTYLAGFNVSTFAIPAVPSTPNDTLTDQPMYELQPGATGLGYPTDVAFDNLGNMYVANNGLSGGTASILVFPMNATGNVAPTRTLGYFSELYGVAVGP